ILDTPGVNPSFRKRLIVATQRIATKSGLYPTCYELKEVVAEDGDPVDSGGFADIYKGTYRGQVVCLKTFRLSRTTQIDYALRQISKEVLLWGQLEHPNIATIYGIFHFRGRICIVAPWLDNGDIRKYLAANPQASRLRLALDVASGLLYLHENCIIHGDLKAPNVLVDDAGRARLADFGISSVTDSNIIAWTSHSRGTSTGGTIRWQAPELFNPIDGDDPTNTLESDIYAWGCVLFEIFTGEIPFHHIRNDYAVMVYVNSGGRPLRPNSLNPVPGMTREVWALMERCWKESPSERPSSAEITRQLSTQVRKEDTRPLAEDGHLPSEFRRQMSDYDQIIDVEFLDRILSPAPEHELVPADENEWIAKDVMESKSVKGNEFRMTVEDLLKEYFHQIDGLFGGKRFASIIGDIALNQEIQDKLLENQAKQETKDEVHVLRINSTQGSETLPKEGDDQSKSKAPKTIAEAWRDGRQKSAGAGATRKERVEELAKTLVHKLEMFTESATASNEVELSQYWLEICEHDANELKGESYGVELLRTIGFVYVAKAKQFLATKKTRFGVGGLLHSVKGNYRAVTENVSMVGTIYRLSSAEIDIRWADSEGLSPEEVDKLKERWSERGLYSWFKQVRLEIESVLRETCDRVLEEKNTTPEKARLRAVALEILGDAFMA
ncbi:hypothetical protein C0991_004556, partial [Blastosporella zonata]